MSALFGAAWFVAGVVGGVRWLRVAQAEHYLPGAPLRFAARWVARRPSNGLLLAVVALGLVALPFDHPLGMAGAVALGCFPDGLALRGRTSRLAWTRRMKTLAGVAAGLYVAVAGVLGLVIGWAGGAALAALAAPLIVDLALRITKPIEERLAQKWVDTASARVKHEVAPTIVAITGSYGKTSTKHLVAHLIGSAKTVVASPRSFNNRAGLARAVNENLVPGTDVFVAEMGTYGPGEIAALCEWLPPDIAVITAIGPVHLERFRSLDVTLAAKSEITARASTVVLNIDDERLAGLATRLAGEGKTVWRCSAFDRTADVAVVDEGNEWHAIVKGTTVATFAQLDGAATNAACALGVAAALGVAPTVAGPRLASVPTVEHRLVPAPHPKGGTILDDTFNSNPAGAARALDLLARSVGEGGTAYVVTPGMVELGPLQAEENERFARAAVGMGATLVVVGRTNRKALVDSGRDGGAQVVVVDQRPAAVSLISERIGPGDAVLFENDLPDVYP